MQLHRQSKVRTSENSLLFIFPTNKTKVLQSPHPQKNPKRLNTNTTWKRLVSPLQLFGPSKEKTKHKTKKVQK